MAVTKHLSATDLVTDIKKALSDQEKRVAEDARKAGDARRLVEALHEKARDKTNVAIIKCGGLLPNPKHLDWENDTDAGDTKQVEYSSLKHGYEKGELLIHSDQLSALTRCRN